MDEIDSENFRVAVADVAKQLKPADYDVLVYVGIKKDGGAISVASSHGTPLTLNLLAQGIMLIEGKFDSEG